MRRRLAGLAFLLALVSPGAVLGQREEVLAEIRAALRHADPVERVYGLQRIDAYSMGELWTLHFDELWAAVVPLLADENAMVRLESAHAIYEALMVNRVPDLVGGDPAAAAANRGRLPDLAEEVAAYLDHPDARFRQELLIALANWHPSLPSTVLPWVLPALDDPDLGVVSRGALAAAAVRPRDGMVVSKLVELCRHERFGRSAVAALAFMYRRDRTPEPVPDPPAEVLAALTAVLRDSSSPARIRAAQAFAEIGRVSPHGLAALRAMAAEAPASDDPSNDPAAHARGALSRLERRLGFSALVWNPWVAGMAR